MVNKPITLYLDFDGVLHPAQVYVTRHGEIQLRAPGALFMHQQMLATILQPYITSTRIFLSTSWVPHLGLERAKSFLDPTLVLLVEGATWEPESDEFDLMTWCRLSRYEQIARHALRHGIESWLAIDDDNNCWPGSAASSLVLCADRRAGLGVPRVQKKLQLQLKRLALTGSQQD